MKIKMGAIIFLSMTACSCDIRHESPNKKINGDTDAKEIQAEDNINYSTSHSSIANGDTASLDKNLPVYQAKPCLSSLLMAVGKVNKKYYPPDTFFYSLTFLKGARAKYLNVSVERWKAAKSLDYSGVIKFNYATFLCRGDFATDSLFYKVKPDFLRIQLRQVNDSADTPLNTEPSLRGAYQECNGQRISLEIYTRGQIPGYKMKERQPLPKKNENRIEPGNNNST